jgi:peptidoglycan/LPS O-acetylase OafA/YrhL
MFLETQTSPKLPALTSLRFFAAALIVAYHAGVILHIGNIFANVPASQGVSFFYVLSGFILAYAYPSFPNRASVAKFYVARFARIWPVHFVTLIIWTIVIYKASPDAIEWNHGIARLLATLTLTQSWVPIEVWATSFNGVSWSISVEMFFYLCFPLLILHLRKSWHIIFSLQALLVVALIWVSRFSSHSDPTIINSAGMIYFSPLVRLLEFSTGITVWLLVQRVKSEEIPFSCAQWTFVEAACIAAMFMGMLLTKHASILGSALGADAEFYVAAAGTFPIFAIVIAVFSLGAGLLSKWLSAKPMVFLGEISFSLYMVHYTVVIYFQQHPAAMAYGWWSYSAVWIISMASAVVLFFFVEQPARKLILGYFRRRASMRGIPAERRQGG